MGRHRLSRVIVNCGQWAITRYGIECLHRFYVIDWGRINPATAQNWRQHLARKDWVTPGDFERALDFALELKAGAARARNKQSKSAGRELTTAGAKGNN